MNSAEIVKVIESELSRKGIKKDTFYKECGISSATFSQWRSGLYYPNRYALKRIAEYLNLKIELSKNMDICLRPREELQLSKESQIDPVSDDQLKYALFGTVDGITEGMLEDIKRYAKMVLCFEIHKNEH